MFYSILQHRDRDQSIQDGHDAELEAAREADSFSFGLKHKLFNPSLDSRIAHELSLHPGGRHCNTCPFDVGDTHERDCSYPDCSTTPRHTEEAMNDKFNSEDPNYIRELRKQITISAYSGDRLDGTSHSQSMAPALARQILTIGERAGLSGEDTMTLLAYHALVNYEKVFEKCLEHSKLNVHPMFINLDSGLQS